jgi:hypothetical protein
MAEIFRPYGDEGDKNKGPQEEAIPAYGPVTLPASCLAHRFSKDSPWSHVLNFRVSYLPDGLPDGAF